MECAEGLLLWWQKEVIDAVRSKDLSWTWEAEADLYRYGCWKAQSDLILWFLGDPAANWLRKERRPAGFYAVRSAMER